MSGHANRSRPTAAILLTVLLVACAASIPPAIQASSVARAGASMRTLTTAREAHNLSSGEAARSHPIHLRAVVTYFDNNSGNGSGALFVHDATGSVFVKFASGTIRTLPIGSLVDVQGVSDPGGFAPVVAHAQVNVIRQAKLPDDAVPVSRTVLFAGGYEGQWVEVEGVVHSVTDSGHLVTIELAMADGILFTTTIRQEGAEYSNLVDAKIRIHGNEAPLYNNRSQMIGARVIFPDLSTVRVIEPAARNPFNSAVLPIDRMLLWDQVSRSSHRVHLRGRVTMYWPGISLCIRDATRGICARTSETLPIAMGNEADVAGFVGADNATAGLTNAVFQKVDEGQPVHPYPTTPGQVMQGRQESELIQIDGQLIGRDLSSSDTTLLLTAGNFFFTAVLPKSLTTPGKETWKNGSGLRITGICSVQFDPQLSVLKDGAAVPKSFRILMRSSSDVVVVRPAPWWTPPHATMVLALALCVTLAILVWVIVLRRRVEQQASLLRDSEERFRHMALHDSLTGLATRLLLQDRLTVALESAKRHRTSVVLLMVDVDRFKEINDTYGHQAGDDVLKVTAERLQRAVRREDTVARIGGDELVVLLSDLPDPETLKRVAAKIVETLARPIPRLNTQIPVSVSVGICVCNEGELDPDALLRNADAALYRAKQHGRNRFELFDPQVPISFEI
jgi:diguanylate cyclase (GGDEF)-like protein